MKIELTITELLLIVDMIKNGTEQNNEGDDSYTVKELYDAFINGVDTKLKCTVCGSTDDVMFSATRNFNAYCKKCRFK